MLRSLYSGISGLHAHQQMMDVTGNNIANVNTVGFKASSVQFQDTLSQMLGAAGAPQNNQGGTNPAQVGLGVQNSGILSNWAQGSQETTGRSGDMMIQGDGFFITRNGNENIYTRAGSFTFDGNGLLVNATGEAVQGWTATDGVVNSAAKPGDITMPLGSTIPPKATANITLKGNLTSDVDAANPTDYPKNYAIPVKCYDKLGTPSTQVVNFQQAADGTYSAIYPWDTSTNAAVTGATTTAIPFGTTTPGKPDSPNFTITNPNGDAYTVDISDLTNFSGQSDARVFEADGQVAGALTSLSYTVSDTGQIIGVYSNGLKQVLGQIAMATFKNTNGLEKTGNSGYRETVNSGYAQVGVPASAGMGQVISGALEMSNVDLAQEFTNLVIAQRGFQANSRVITTSDELLQELVSMKR
jgi:flagellar hook protein FlgE